jgi:hypothetical protein
MPQSRKTAPDTVENRGVFTDDVVEAAEGRRSRER